MPTLPSSTHTHTHTAHPACTLVHPCPPVYKYADSVAFACWTESLGLAPGRRFSDTGSLFRALPGALT